MRYPLPTNGNERDCDDWRTHSVMMLNAHQDLIRIVLWNKFAVKHFLSELRQVTSEPTKKPISMFNLLLRLICCGHSTVSNSARLLSLSQTVYTGSEYSLWDKPVGSQLWKQTNGTTKWFEHRSNNTQLRKHAILNTFAAGIK